MTVVIFTIIGVVSVVGNILVLIVVRKSKELRHSQYIYKCSIALSDIIWGLIVSAFFIWETLNAFIVYSLRESPNYKMPNIIKVENEITYKFELDLIYLERSLQYDELLLLILLCPITLFVSFITLVFAAADRYFAIAFPIRYKTTNTIKLAKIFSVIIWVISTIGYVCSVFIDRDNIGYATYILQPTPCVHVNCTASTNQTVTAAVLSTLLGLLWILTVLTLYELYKNYKQSKKLNTIKQKGLSLEKQKALTFALMLIAFTFSLSPTIYLHIYYYFFNESYSGVLKMRKQFFVSILFLYSNSIWNVVLYSALNQKFRKAFFKLKTSL